MNTTWPDEPGLYFAKGEANDENYTWLVFVRGEKPFLRIDAIWKYYNGTLTQNPAPGYGMPLDIWFGPRIAMHEEPVVVREPPFLDLSEQALRMRIQTVIYGVLEAAAKAEGFGALNNTDWSVDMVDLLNRAMGVITRNTRF